MAAETGPKNSAEPSKYVTFLRRTAERILSRPEFQNVRNWFSERVGALPKMTVRTGRLTGEGGWGKEMEGDEIKKIISGFFDVEGYYIETTPKNDKKGFSWNQAGITQKEDEVTITTPEGTDTIAISGVVGLLRDEEGRILLSVGQEPLADTENHALVRTPYQASARKLKELLEGKKELDPTLSELIHTLGNGKSLHELFASGEVKVFPLGYADANRIKATNIGFSFIVKDKETHNKLATGGKRWCTPAEIQALAAAGLVNDHTMAAIFPHVKLAVDQSLREDREAA